MMWDDGNGRWSMHGDGYGAGWLMVLLMLVVAIAVVVAVVAILRGTTSLSTTPHTAPGVRAPDPRAILKERFARGEIDEQDYRTRMRTLDESGG